MTNQVKIKVTDSTSIVPFNNTSNAFYDMIITIQNISISQTISIYDVEGNLINDKPLYFDYPVKIIIKDVPIGSISFEDVNVYDVILSYVIKSQPEGIPYIDFITETSIHPPIPVNSFYNTTFTSSIFIDFSTLLENAGVTNINSVISIQSIYYFYTASATGSYGNLLQVNYPDGLITIDNFSSSVTSGETYDFTFNSSIYKFQQLTNGYEILIPLPNPIIISNGQKLYIDVEENENITSLSIAYQVIS
jgi:hypothetical protein